MKQYVYKTLVFMLVASFLTGCGTEQKGQVPKTLFKELETTTVIPKEIESTFNLTGRVVPLQKVDIVAEVQGTARTSSKGFEEGTSFRKGQLLLSIDDHEFRYNLNAQKSQFLSALVTAMADVQLDYPQEFPTWNAFLQQVDVQKPLPALPSATTEQLKYFLSSRNIFNLYYSIKSQEDKLRDYRLYAPFDGSLTQALIDAGDLVRPGTKLGEIIRTDVYEIRASIPAQLLDNFTIGKTTELYIRNIDYHVTATLKRIGKSLDADTQAIPIFFEVPGNNLIKEGMYAEANFITGSHTQAVKLNNDLISRDNRVYVINDSTVVAKEVKVLQTGEKESIVQGLEKGDAVVTENVTKSIAGIKAQPKTK